MTHTKAQKIFDDTRYICRRHLNSWGAEYNPDGSVVGFNSMEYTGTMSTRTFNDVQHVIDSNRKSFETFSKIRNQTPEEIKAHDELLGMIQSTLNNQRKSYEAFEAELKDL